MDKLTSQSCGELQPAVCLSRGNIAIWRRPEHSWTSSPGNFQHRYLPELLVNVYSYHLMVNSVSWCCVCVWKVAFLKSGHICLLHFSYPSYNIACTTIWPYMMTLGLCLCVHMYVQIDHFIRLEIYHPPICINIHA